MDGMLQTWLVGAIVAACAGHVAWRLLPATARRALAARAQRLPLPAPLARALRRTAETSRCGDCGGCADGTSARPVTFHRRPPGR